MRFVIISFHTNYFSEEPEVYHYFGFRLNASEISVDSVKDKANAEGDFEKLSEQFESHLDATFDFITIGYEEVFGGSVYELEETELPRIRSTMEFLRDWFIAAGCDPGEMIHTTGSLTVADETFRSLL